MAHSYEPLKTKHSIRLIKLLGRTEAGLVNCALEQHELTSAPTYHALSYYWGDPYLVNEISLGWHGKRLIHKNLWDFLDQMVSDKHLGYYWTDALSIDQRNVEEKNHQVEYMGHIYQRARSVVIWLGREPRLQISMQLLVKVKWWDCIREGSDLLQRPIFDLLAVPYWNRTWIIQEICLARSAKVVCGCFSLRLDSFIAIARHCSEDDYRRFVRESLGQRLQQEAYGVSRAASRAKIFRLFAVQQQKGIPTFWDLIREFSDSNCVDPRDKVFGLLGLARRNGERIPNIVAADYGKDVHEVFWDAVFGCAIPDRYLKSSLAKLAENMAIPASTILTSLADRVEKGRRGKTLVLYVAKAVNAAFAMYEYESVYLALHDLNPERWEATHKSQIAIGIALGKTHDLPFDSILCDWQPTWQCRLHRIFDNEPGKGGQTCYWCHPRPAFMRQSIPIDCECLLPSMKSKLRLSRVPGEPVRLRLMNAEQQFSMWAKGGWAEDDLTQRRGPNDPGQKAEHLDLGDNSATASTVDDIMELNGRIGDMYTTRMTRAGRRLVPSFFAKSERDESGN